MRPKIVATAIHEIAKYGVTRGIRVNGRSLDQFRDCHIVFGKSYGSCEVHLVPGTRVLCQVSASIGEPMDSRPGEGILTISTWISPAATGEMGGSGSQKPSIIARSLEKLFKENRSLDVESLCIKYGERVWVLRADLHILETNGCLAEAASLALLGAFQTFRLGEAKVEINSGELIKVDVDHTNPKKLHLYHLPIMTSFALSDTNIFLAEPDHNEEEIFNGKLMVAFNESKELCYLHLTNPIDRNLLTSATTLAEAICLQRIKLLKSLIVEREKEMSVPVYLKRNLARTNGISLEISNLDQ